MKRILFGLGTLLLLVGCGGPSIERSDSFIVIDAGHGGHDSGVLLRYQVYMKKHLVLQIAKKPQRKFKAYGIQGTPHTFEVTGLLIFLERTRIADRKDAKVFISSPCQLP